MTVTLYIEKDKKSDYKDIMGIQVGDLKFTRQEKEDIEEFFKHAAEEIYNQYQVMLKDIYKPGNIKFIYYPKKETKSTIKNLKYYQKNSDHQMLYNHDVLLHIPQEIQLLELKKG